MSFRALRKIQGDSKLVPDVYAAGLSESDDADFSPTQSRRPQGSSNPFDLLNREQTPSDNEAKEDDDKENEDDKDGKSGEEDGDKSQAMDSLKRKKKRKKRKAKATKDKISSEENMDVEDEIDASVREVNKILGEPIGDSIASTSSGIGRSERNLYSVEHRHLNPDNEMKRIFGFKIIQAEQGKRRGRGRGHVRSTWLVQTRQNWPTVGKPGISMNLVETKGDVHYFTFDHSPHYQQIQYQFLDAVDSFNPDNIVSVLNMHPYHIDCFLQLSEVCKMAEDMQMATELIERALYCLECCFHPLFNLATGNCRLDYRRSENRSMFIALFKHLLFVGQRGCYRTALEFCKLLLGLDPENDPLCVTLMIDFYALRAGEYLYLLKMFRDLEVERNLSQLPNFAFSVALASFHLSQQEQSPIEQADDRLQWALIMFPSVLAPLLEKCSVQPDEIVSKHSFFTFNIQPDDPEALIQLVKLFVGRCYHLWKEPEVVAWLERNVRDVLRRVEAGDPLVEDCREKRRVRYQGTPRNIYRHILMSEIKDASAALPAELTQRPFMSYDPLPPADAIVTYARPTRSRPMDDHNTLSIFFRSLFPNFSLDEPGGGNPMVAGVAGNEGQLLDGVPDAELGRVAAAGAGDGLNTAARSTNDLRRSVTSLLDAMRDLLANMHLPEVAQDADDSDTAHDN